MFLASHGEGAELEGPENHGAGPVPAAGMGRRLSGPGFGKQQSSEGHWQSLPTEMSALIPGAGLGEGSSGCKAEGIGGMGFSRLPVGFGHRDVVRLSRSCVSLSLGPGTVSYPAGVCSGPA